MNACSTWNLALENKLIKLMWLMVPITNLASIISVTTWWTKLTSSANANLISPSSMRSTRFLLMKPGLHWLFPHRLVTIQILITNLPKLPPTSAQMTTCSTKNTALFHSPMLVSKKSNACSVSTIFILLTIPVWFTTWIKPCALRSSSCVTATTSLLIPAKLLSLMKTPVVSCKVVATAKVSTKPLKLKKASWSKKSPWLWLPFLSRISSVSIISSPVWLVPLSPKQKNSSKSMRST